MGWGTLVASRADLASDGAKTREREIEIQRRLAVPSACVLMPWLGVALGVRQSHAARSRGVAVGLAAILVYYFLVTAGMTLVHQGIVSAPLALWAPNILLLAVAVVAFRRVAVPPGRRGRE
jgi:lipopolysaccharide export LptBFGC system permease protein LptF